MLALQSHRRAQQRAAPAGIHHVVDREVALVAIRLPQPRGGGGRAEADAQHFRFLVGFGAAGGRVCEQQSVQVLAADLDGVAATRVQGAGEIEYVVTAFVRRRKVGAEFPAAHGHHLVEDAQPLENRDIHRQQRLADVEAGMTALFHQGHAQAPAGQQGCRRGAAGAAANHQHMCAISLF